MHMVQHVLLLDFAPIAADLRPDEGAPAPGHAAPAAPRASRRAARPPGLRDLRSTSAIMWVWHVPALYDAALYALGRPRPRARLLPERRAPLLVAPAVADPQPPPPQRDGRGRLHALDEAARRPARDRPHVRPGAAVRLLQGAGADLGPHARPRTSRSPAALMAFEQSVVMGIALVWLFVNALTASDAAERRAERYGEVT